MRGRFAARLLLALAVVSTASQLGPLPVAQAASSRSAALALPSKVAPPVRTIAREPRKMPKPAHHTKITATYGTAQTDQSLATPKTDAARAAVTALPSPPFTQCPPIGADTAGCGILIQLTGSQTNIIADSSEGPYDGSDDTLVGVVNNTNQPVSSVLIDADTDVFGFDGDGICSGAYSPEPAGCPFGPTGYEGPNTSFADSTPDGTAGVVLFGTPLAPGGTAYFSLEEALSATTLVVGGPSAAEAGGAPNPSELPTTCYYKAPVNCATGEFWHQFTDVAVPGRGAALNLTRTYSSALAGVDGPFGFGWSSSYGMSLSTDPAGNVTVNQEDGATVTFQPNGSGGYSAPTRVLATLTANPDGTLTFSRDADHLHYLFSSAGTLLSETDLNGETTTLNYSGGQLTSVTDPAGRTLTFTYTGTHITKATDPMGRSETYSYDAAGNLASTNDAAARTWSFSYDANHLLLSMTDPRGGATTNTYNVSSQVTTQVDPKGAKTTWSYSGDATSPGGGTTTITDPNGNLTTENYANLELNAVTHGVGTPAQAVTSYTYDPGTLGVATMTDPNGNVTHHTYDHDGNLLSTTDPLGRTTGYQYNALDERTSTTSPLGESTIAAYDTNGNLLSTTDPLNNTTTFNHADSTHPGDVTSITDPAGHIETFTYDTQGDVATASTSPAVGVSDTTAFSYDADGERICTASPTATAAHIACPAAGAPRVAGTISTVFDTVGEVTSSTDPDGHTTAATYDADGNTTSSIDADGNTTGYQYDPDNQQTAVHQSDGTTTATGYDPDGNTLTQTDAAGDTTTYAYDALDRVTSTTDPLGRTTSYAYDPAGNQTGLTDPSGHTTSSAYDVANEPTSTTYSDGTTPNVTYAYTADGQRASITDGTGTTSYSYDADGRITATTNGVGATVGYAYDPAGELSSLTYPNGQSVTRAYDGAGQLASVKDWLGNTTAFDYNPDGQLTAENYPNSVTATTAYDPAGQLTSILDTHNTTTLASYTYTRDSNGQLTSATETGVPSGAAPYNNPLTYSYTKLNQLGAVDASSYGYDKANNLTTLPDGTTQTFDAAGQLKTLTPPAASTPGSPTLDTKVNSVEQKSTSPITSPALTTSGGNELLLAMISADGPATGQQTVTKVTGGGLTWTLATRANKVNGTGTAEVWQAYATTPLQAVKVSATLKSANFDGAITVAAYTDASRTLGTTAARGALRGAATLPLTTTAPGSLVLATGHDWSAAHKQTPLAGQIILTQNLDTRVHDTYWTQTTAPLPSAGTAVTIGESAPTTDRWELAAVEILPATPVSTPGTPTNYGYDPQGNRTTTTPTGGVATTLTYDQANRLTTYTKPGTTTLAATYTYDGDGVRASKTVNGTTTHLTYDQSTTPLLLTDGTTSYIYGPAGQPIEQITGTTPTYLQADQQGSTRLLTDTAGTVTGAYTYNPYGQTLAHTGTATTPLQYAGQYTDQETGYLYLRARYYDPATGQFLTKDPLASLTQSPYAYAEDDPTNLSDPTGLCGLWGKHTCGWVKSSEDWVGENAGTISAVAGTLAVGAAFIPVVGEVASPILGGISLGTGLIATAHDASKGDVTATAVDILALVPGVGAEVKSIKALNLSRELEAAVKAAADYRGTSVEEIVALLERTGQLNNLHREYAAWGDLLGFASAALSWLGVYVASPPKC